MKLLFQYKFYTLLKENDYNHNNERLISYIIYFLFFLSYCLYYLALEKCFEGQYECGKKLGWIRKKLFQAIFSAVIHSILFELMILKLITKLHLIHVIIFLLIFYNYSHGDEFYDHGFFNFLGHNLIVIISLILIFPINILIYLIKINNKALIFIYLTFLIFIFFLYIQVFHFNLNCKDWARGLNNTYIENNIKIYGCEIKIPKICPYKIGSYFLDMSKIYNVKCGEDLSGRKKTLKYAKSPYINENTTKFGYPLTNKDPKCLKLPSKKNIKKYVSHNLFDMNNKEQSNIPEIVTDFSNNPYGELIINVNYNETISKERKELEKNTNPLYENIMILFFDSVSRTNGLRQLKKTLKFIEKFMPYKGYSNKFFPNEKYHSFQFMKYHSFKYNTGGNYPKMFYGHNKGEKMVRITKYLKQNGYVTAFTNDFCNLDSCYLNRDMSLEEIADHEYLICDVNNKGINSMIKRCLYDKINVEHQLEYGNQFWRKYKNNRRFLLIVNNDGHEGTLEILKYDDEYVFEFLNNLFNENLLKDTIVMIVSDHGCTMPSIYYFYDSFNFDISLPMLYILSYDKKNLSYNEQYKFIYENQQKFITAYDIYNTIGHLVYGKYYKKIKNKEKSNKDTPKTKYGKSIFTKIYSKRTPYNYQNMEINVCISYNN
jgi:predicted DNA-binding protein YlxM (UPF0122 family)